MHSQRGRWERVKKTILIKGTNNEKNDYTSTSK